MRLRLIPAFAALLFALIFTVNLPAADKPNIVIILADDMGYGDVQAYNPQAATRTPRIDELAAAGLRFTDGHAAASVCTPSRYALLTGRYCWRTPLKKGVLNPTSAMLIDDNCDTMASMLKRNGYATAVVGKWHLGLGRKEALKKKLSNLPAGLQPGPNQRGFDYSFILDSSLNEGPYVFIRNSIPVNSLTGLPSPPVSTWKTTNGGGPYPEPLGFVKGPIAPGFDPAFDADPTRDCRFNKAVPRLATEAVSVINQRAATPTQPFFLYFAIPAPHTPWMPDVDTTGLSNEQLYMDYVDEVDGVVGQVTDALKKNGFWGSNTMVLFLSDNGPELRRFNRTLAHHDPAGGFRGEKSDLYEGGHRQPFIVTWPGHLAANATSGQLISYSDLYRTFATLVGDVRPPGMIGGEDSIDFSTLFLGQPVDHPLRTNLVHHSGQGRFAIRVGDWKYIDWPGSGGYVSPNQNPEGTPAQLFNLAKDPAEKVNLYASEPARVAQMKALLVQIQGPNAPKPGDGGQPKFDDTVQ
jgi:arylsulfatase A-like enzyme